MKSFALKASPRSQTRRGRVKKLRDSGRVPAVIYGRKEPSRNLEIEARHLDEVIHHSATENVLVELAIKDDSQPNRLALVQDIQHHVLSGHVLHVDFHEVAADEKVTFMVPVETEGEAIGVKTGGGVLEHVLFKVRLRGLPRDLPEVLTVDVSNLNIGETIHLGDLPLPEGVEMLGDKQVPVIAVAQPKAEVVEPAPGEAVEGLVAEAVKEPEVIKEKKAEAEGEKKPEKKAEKEKK